MRKLLFIIVLFFSTSVLAEVYNCTIFQKNSNSEYTLLVDIGKGKDNLTLSTIDKETGKYAGETLAFVESIGKIYFEKNNPYKQNTKIDTKVFFTHLYYSTKIGLFFPYEGGPLSTIVITNRNTSNLKIYISDTFREEMKERTQEGVCE